MFTVMIIPLKHKETPFFKVFFNSFFLLSSLLWDIAVTCIILYVTVKKRILSPLFGVYPLMYFINLLMK